jgi:hypothetical protein
MTGLWSQPIWGPIGDDGRQVIPATNGDIALKGPVVETLGTVLMLAAATGIALWMAGAIYCDVCGCSKWGQIVAVAWLFGVVAVFVCWQPLWQPFVLLLGVFAVFLVWWFRIKPSHDREWEPAVAVLPRAIRDNDTVTIENVRDFEYRSATDFTVRYETRTYRLVNLTAADVIFFNWGSALMSHPVVVFDFGTDGRVCLSIEVRYRLGQAYSILASLYRHYELIIVAADERDAILRRTKFGPPQDAHLYQMVATAAELRAAFLDYVDTFNDLYGTPRWYHGLCTNCTTSFYQFPSIARRWDWRVLVNARLDQALYAAGRLDQSLPFLDLRQAAYLTDVANAAPANGFGDHVRSELERRRHER